MRAPGRSSSRSIAVAPPEPDEPDTPEQLKARALRYLVRREHSRAELARKLAPHAASPQAVQALLDALLSKRQLSDERFASERARVLSRKYGAARIRHDLKSKGVADEIAEKVAAQSDDLAKAREILRRKFPVETKDRAEQARRARFLQGRGFSYDVITRVLKDVE